MEDLKIYEIDSSALSRRKFARIHTSKGDMSFELFADSAPQNVSNFIALADSGFYNGLNFHRVIPGFVAQGGCPRGDGRGGPGWRVKCELKGNAHKHARGALSMAHAGRDTGGSQFFIVLAPQPHLDGEHTVFGAIRGDDDDESFAVLDSIRQGDEIVKVEILESL